jgi:hypothetical protein
MITSFQIRPLRPDFLLRARDAGIDDLGQRVEHHIAIGGEPCRDVFRRAEPGEALVLASYCPFERAGPYREYGPVFILAASASDSTPPAQLPMHGDRPYLGASFVLRAYSDEERIAGAVLTTPERAQDDLLALVGQHRPAFVLARFPAYGCYALRIDTDNQR